jgi:vacuolar-type H+-ATPase subunit I/STV1
MARESLNTQKDARFDTSCEKLKVACLPATSLVSWPRLNNAEMFLNAQMIASSLLGALGLVPAHLVSIPVYLFLSKFVNDPSFNWAMEFAGAHDKSEFVIFHGAVSIAL